jgi:hypothetical protein
MREAQEVEGRWLPEVPLLSPLDDEAPKLDQPRFLRMQFQSEAPQSLTKLLLKPYGLRVVLESHDEVVGIPRDDHVPSRMPPSPLLDPEVEGVVQKDVRQQGREHPSHNVANKLGRLWVVAIPRARLRPAYGDGFRGAPLIISRPAGDSQ